MGVLPDHPPVEELIPAVRLVAFDFDGVFTDNSVFVFEDGSEAVRCSRSDGIGLRKLDKLGLETVVISSETNTVVAVRCRKLRIRCVQDTEDKLARLRDIVGELDIDLSRVAFVGNDINDLKCMERVGMPIAVEDAYPVVVQVACYKTAAPGGRGAVREVCDLFERVLRGDSGPSGTR